MNRKNMLFIIVAVCSMALGSLAAYARTSEPRPPRERIDREGRRPNDVREGV